MMSAGNPPSFAYPCMAKVGCFANMKLSCVYSTRNVFAFADVPPKTRGETDHQAAEIFRNVAWNTFSVYVSEAGSGEWSTAHRVGNSIIVSTYEHYTLLLWFGKVTCSASCRVCNTQPLHSLSETC